ncbi:MAG: hypothetical protein JW808_10020 [Victivallales bacterium]|nr:hypothetical protein [Victivallales bacterium]
MKSQFPKNLHFIGIAGAGTSGLAVIMAQRGHAVTGSDLEPAKTSAMLERNGTIAIKGHSPGNIPEVSPLLVVRSSAVREDNCELRKALESGHECISRGEMLARLAAEYEAVAAVAGSHGKTSVTAMLAHILKSCGMSPGYMIGGGVSGWEASADAGDGCVFVTESDESDGTQVLLRCDILLLTNIDDDHAWNFGGEEALLANFAKLASRSRRILYTSNTLLDDFLKSHPDTKAVARDASLSSGNRWGDFQRDNASLAVECAVELGIPREQALCEVRKFPGVERRMSLRYRSYNIVIVEDYAHHPTELRAALSALRSAYAGRWLRVVFQPHRYARMEKYLKQFACELRKADEAVVVPVFSAWSQPGAITSETLAEETGANTRYSAKPWGEMARELLATTHPNELLAVVGAGDIEELTRELVKLAQANQQST